MGHCMYLTRSQSCLHLFVKYLYCHFVFNYSTCSLALPGTAEFDPAIVNVFRDEEATIACPFMFGNLHDYFDPYEITWIKREFGQFPVTLAEPDESFRISGNGTELHLPTSSPTNSTYQCRLILSRCTFFRENNDVSERCELESPFLGPVTSLNVLGMLTFRPSTINSTTLIL